ncbi:DNA polymerase III subunit delta' [Luteimonas dalianensis]|uniref:DNA polymerase III subunit delta' n=1 Tax=Luteimonas dalianensis TaxID=1148196 RepID=UPI003BF0CBCA
MPTAPLAPWQQRMYERAVEALDSGRMGHALLLSGPERLGKRAVAERLAQYVLCTAKEGARPCGRCRSCELYAARSQRDPLEHRPDGSLSHPDGHPMHPDAVFVSYAWRMSPSPQRQLTQVSVDQIRELSERLGKSAQYGGGKVAIIEPAEAMNENACNALLKTLEEPQPGRYLWLVAANPMRLPATIRSRCQRLEFRLPPREEALAWLGAQGYDDRAATEALDAARGHPGLAASWLRDGGMELRREVAADLAALARGELAPSEAARRWTAEGADAVSRLGHAADIAVGKASGLTDPERTRRLAAWFDEANRTRDLLRTTVRADLAVAGLLLRWRELAAAGR